MNRICVYIFVLVYLVCALMVNAVNKYSAEANKPLKNHFKLDPEINVRTVDKPYRMAKLNMLWSKAQVVSHHLNIFHLLNDNHVIE